jgi:hypothetical protein
VDAPSDDTLDDTLDDAFDEVDVDVESVVVRYQHRMN